MSKKYIIIDLGDAVDLDRINKINTFLSSARGMLAFNRKFPEEEPYPLEEVEKKLEDAINIFNNLLEGET